MHPFVRLCHGISEQLTNPSVADEATLGVRRLHELIGSEPRVSATAIQTVGAKGHDGFTIALMR